MVAGAILAAAILLSPAPPAGAAFIRAEGQRFIDADGRPFVIKGMSVGNWLMPEGYMFKFERAKAPRQIEAVFARLIGDAAADRFWRTFRDTYVTAADIRFMASVGFNTVRVPLHWRLFVAPGEPPVFAGDGYRLLDGVIGWARDTGMKVIIDLHAAPGGQTGINHDDGPGLPLMFYVPAHQALTVALWRHLAERYRDEPVVLGYDLLNEPITPYADTDYLNPRLEPFYRRLVAAIRAVDDRHVIFLAASQWSTSFAPFGPPFAPNLAYTYHKFWSSTRRDAIQPYLDFSNRYNVPLFLGESGELTDEWTADFRRLHDRFGLSWSFWTYKNLDSPSTVVSIPRPPGWGAIVAAADRPGLAPPPPREVAQATLDAYLAGFALDRATINWSYLAALSLGPRPERGAGNQ
jgi:hypothetical protein